MKSEIKILGCLFPREGGNRAVAGGKLCFGQAAEWLGEVAWGRAPVPSVEAGAGGQESLGASSGCVMLCCLCSWRCQALDQLMHLDVVAAA